MKALAALLLAVPLTSGDGWHVLRFDRIPPHVVRFSEAGLTIDVDGSAAPVIYPLPEPQVVRSIAAHGRIHGTLNVSGARQGRAGFDDYALRVGLVEVGRQRPGPVRRRFAPAWLQRLWALAPADTGIAAVHFFNLGVDDLQKGQRRRHPSSRLLHERVVGSPMSDGRFHLQETLDRPIAVSAIWISADGDDTRSRFTTTLERLVLD